LGSRKFGSFVVLSLVLSSLLQLGLVVVALSIGYDIIPSIGPYFLIFSLIPFYYVYIPKTSTQQYSLFGLAVSEKSWTYLLALQLVLGENISSIIASLAGLIAGYLYIQDHTKKLQKFRLPRSIENSVALVGGFFSSLTPPAQIQPNRELQNHLEQQH
jgi:membrane associated rhomboid family serine protease